MVAKEGRQVLNEITAHIDKQIAQDGGKYSNWYCGITSDINSRLHGDHKVPQKDHWFISRPCFNETDSRAVEASLIKLGCDGAPGGGDETTVIVYAYLKTAITNP